MLCFFSAKGVLGNQFITFNNLEVIVFDKKVLIIMHSANGAVAFPNFNGLICLKFKFNFSTMTSAEILFHGPWFQSLKVKYFLFNNLLSIIANRTIKDAPTATGINIKPIPFAPRIAIIGLAPAGG